MFQPNASIHLWADGACSGNPGPGGWGAVLIHVPTGAVRELSGGVAQATNNRMELCAILEGLRAVRRPRQCVAVYSDSLAAVSWLTGEWRIKDPALAIKRADALAQAQARRLRRPRVPP